MVRVGTLPMRRLAFEQGATMVRLAPGHAASPPPCRPFRPSVKLATGRGRPAYGVV
jgi:hypothetical protein